MSKAVGNMNTTAEDLKFGTSGVRGLVTQFTSENCFRYGTSFAELLKTNFPKTSVVYMSRDLRDSSARIQDLFSVALEKQGYKVISLGEVPTPTLALFAMTQQAAALMITGSHIPADRNGVKFYTPAGEITKTDEIEIRKNFETLSNGVATLSNGIVNVPKDSGVAITASGQPTFANEAENQIAAEQNYLNRYLNFFGKDFLNGTRVLFYQHSTVGRDLLPKILQALGAQVLLTARSEKFIPVDTENVSNKSELEDLMFKNDIDVLVSADGDADRPLVMHRKYGQIVGDVLGMITANYLGIEAIAVPVSCTSLIEDSLWFKKIERTKIGSPFVISGMEKIVAEFKSVAGFEANGGFLTATEMKVLRPLPTRDAMLPIIVYLKLQTSGWISANEKFLFSKINLSGLLKNFPAENSKTVLNEVDRDPKILVQSGETLRSQFTEIREINKVDGVKIISTSGTCVHLRPSGNAPEFRVYVEAGSQQIADGILREALDFCEGYRGY